MPDLKLSLDEITDWRLFEDMVAAYFRCNNPTDSTMIRREAKAKGDGPDGGYDIFVEFIHTDTIVEFRRKWLIQCKFHDENVSPEEINGINIPGLIHSKGANGYLLICKKRPTAALTDYFNNLKENCRFGYSYIIWSGEDFKQKLMTAPDIFYRQFFPKYYKAYKKIEAKKK